MNTGMTDAAGGRDRWSDRLSEYLDGDMKPVDRQRLEAHLTECAACTVALADLREVVARARTLEDAPPPEDLWPGIEAQLTPRSSAARPRVGTIVEGRAWWGRRFDLGLPQLAAAAILLVALSAGAVWLAMRSPDVPSAPATTPARSLAGGVARSRAVTPGTAPEVASVPTGQTIEAVPAVAGLGNPRYDAAVAELERTLEEGRGRLDPRTLQVVEQNLRIIDWAIEDARRAVTADPGNTWLRSHLAATMKRKVDLLRSATMLAAAQG
jgi:putative zinc finger protein